MTSPIKKILDTIPDDEKKLLQYTPLTVFTIQRNCKNHYIYFLEGIKFPTSFLPTDEEVAKNYTVPTFSREDGNREMLYDGALWFLSRNKRSSPIYIPFALITFLQQNFLYGNKTMQDWVSKNSQITATYISYIYNTILSGDDFTFQFGYGFPDHDGLIEDHAMAIVGRNFPSRNTLFLIVFEPHNTLDGSTFLPVAEFIALIKENATFLRDIYVLNARVGYQGKAGTCEWITTNFLLSLILRTSPTVRQNWYNPTDPNFIHLSTLEPTIIRRYIDEAYTRQSIPDTSIFSRTIIPLLANHPSSLEDPYNYAPRNVVLKDLNDNLPELSWSRKDAKLSEVLPSTVPVPPKKLLEISNPSEMRYFHLATILENIMSRLSGEEGENEEMGTPLTIPPDVQEKIDNLKTIDLPPRIAKLVNQFIKALPGDLYKAHRLQLEIYRDFDPGITRGLVTAADARRMEEEQREKRKRKRMEKKAAQEAALEDIKRFGLWRSNHDQTISDETRQVFFPTAKRQKKG